MRETSSSLTARATAEASGPLIAKYYRNSEGAEPVDDFINALPVPERASVAFAIELLNELTDERPHLPFPHSSQVERELRELRCHHGRKLYRILYRRSQQFIVLLHIFRKDTAEVPETEKAIARARWDDFKARMRAPPRTPPRAIGKDAP